MLCVINTSFNLSHCYMGSSNPFCLSPYLFLPYACGTPIKVTWIVSPYKYFLMKQIAQLFAGSQNKNPQFVCDFKFPQGLSMHAYLSLQVILKTCVSYSVKLSWPFCIGKDVSKDYRNSLTSPCDGSGWLHMKKKNTLIWWN